MKRVFRIIVRGTVQGVGFRPFVYRLAKSMGFRGWVRNTGSGSVEIVVLAEEREVGEFIERLKREKPPISRISSVSYSEFDAEIPEEFEIVKSGGKTGELSLPPPDVAVCDKCVEEVFDPSNRRYMYPFTSCTDCGPRFTVVERLPYDRENTSFSEFPMCVDCRREYENIEDRRYYAQSIACPRCGPRYRLRAGKSGSGRNRSCTKELDAVIKAAELIDSGKILAVKGIGGYHIACRADSEEVVRRLRKLLRRPQQPFAVMVRDCEVAERVAEVGEEEREILSSYVRPILVVRSRGVLAESVAPSLNTIGIMLPYTPLHHILFSFLKSDCLVMTSANMPGEPMFIDSGVERLGVDAILEHDLRIVNRTDDSVVKVIGHGDAGEDAGGKGKKRRWRMIIRKSRGFIPDRIPVDSDIRAVAVGAELYNSIAVLRDRSIIQSQYIGNTSNFRTYREFFERAFEFWLKFTQLEPDIVFSDMHPLYNTSRFAGRYAEENGVRLVRVQHHFAHAMSVMAERRLDRAVAVAVDGAGYGFDGNTWGCEVLWLDFESRDFRRIARMEYITLPGGDAATEKPGRILFSILHSRGEAGEFDWERMGVNPELLAVQLERGINIAKASSAGRYLDACSAMLGLCYERTYEGEGAMKLEALASCGDLGSAEKILRDMEVELSWNREPAVYDSPFSDTGQRDGKVEVIGVRSAVCRACELLGRVRKEDLALALTLYLARALAGLAVEEALKRDACLVMSGGVAYNSIITPEVGRIAEEEGVEFYVNELTAAGDNGISVGQLYSSRLL